MTVYLDMITIAGGVLIGVGILMLPKDMRVPAALIGLGLWII